MQHVAVGSKSPLLVVYFSENQVNCDHTDNNHYMYELNVTNCLFMHQ